MRRANLHYDRSLAGKNAVLQEGTQSCRKPNLKGENRVMTLEEARRVIAGAEKKAKEMANR
ncbi:MAG: hypothetical protein NVSMB58_32550 [Terriglobales bacterium]